MIYTETKNGSYLTDNSLLPDALHPPQDIVLAILRDEERIMLAPNSAQIPPLVRSECRSMIRCVELTHFNRISSAISYLSRRGVVCGG